MGDSGFELSLHTESRGPEQTRPVGHTWQHMDNSGVWPSALTVRPI